MQKERVAGARFISPSGKTKAGTQTIARSWEKSRCRSQALAVLIELNNKYGLDGRDPNSYSGIFWCLGRYDRPWGPERPIFGQIRYMSSENTARKVRVKNYIRKYGSDGQANLRF